MTTFIRMRTFKQVCSCGTGMVDEPEFEMVKDGYEAINPDHIIKHYSIMKGNYRCIHLSDGSKVYVTLRTGMELDKLCPIDTTIVNREKEQFDE